MHATKLRIKGESEFKRLQLIIEQLPLNETNANSTRSNVQFFLDRGYGKKDIVKFLDKNGYHVSEHKYFIKRLLLDYHMLFT